MRAHETSASSAAATAVASDGVVLDVDNDGFYVARCDTARSASSSSASLTLSLSSSSSASSPPPSPRVPRTGAGESGASSRLRRDLCIVGAMFAMVSLFAIAELVVGLVTRSLSVVADAFHMIGDGGSLAIAGGAMLLARRPRSDVHTYGWPRAETLGAFANGGFLIVVCLFTCVEALTRIVEPEPIRDALVVFTTGVVGLAINVFGVVLFCSHRSLHDSHGHAHSHGHGHDHGGGGGGNANMHGVFLHIVGDALGSVVVVLTGAVHMATDASADAWRVYLDPCASIVYSLFILRSAVLLVRRTCGVLMQAVPRDFDIGALKAALGAIDGVRSVHRLHVWQLSPHVLVGSAHVVCDDVACWHRARRAAQHCFHERNVHHNTVQPEFRARDAPTLSARLADEPQDDGAGGDVDNSDDDAYRSCCERSCEM